MYGMSRSNFNDDSIHVVVIENTPGAEVKFLMNLDEADARQLYEFKLKVKIS